jgi:type VI secretion system protein VasI
MHHAFRVAVLVCCIASIGGCGQHRPNSSAADSSSPSAAAPASTQTTDGITSQGRSQAPAPLDAKALASCAAEPNTVKRLACFDAFASANGLVPTTVSTSSPAAGKWITSTETDPLTDKAVHYAMLTADQGKGRFGEHIVLVVRCQNARTEAFINWSSFLGSDNLDVTSRIDKSAAVTTSWNISTDHKASFVPQASAMLSKFDGAFSFVVNLTPYGESPVTAIFDITGSSDAFKDIRRDCK